MSVAGILAWARDAVAGDAWVPRFIDALARFLASTYLLASVPLRLCYVPDYGLAPRHTVFVALDVCADLYFLARMARKYRSNRPPAPPSAGGVRDASEDAAGCSVLSAVFALDFVATLPLDKLAYIAGKRRLAWWLANRLAHLLQLNAVTDSLLQLLERRHVLANVGLQRMGKLFLAMALAGHWAACSFHYVAWGESQEGRDTWLSNDGLVELREDRDGTFVAAALAAPPEVAYGRAIYWAFVTMCTTGFGDIVPVTIPETLVTLVVQYVGVIICTAAIANLTMLMTNFDAARNAFQQKIESLGKYMSYRRLPRWLGAKILAFYDYQWYLLRGVDEQTFLSELPQTLQLQVSQVMRRDVVRSVPILRKANPAMINAITECVETYVYSPGDEIVNANEQLRGVVMVSRGEIDVLNKRGDMVESKLKRCDHYAEDCLFQDVKSRHVLKARTYTEVLVLSAIAFRDVLQAQCSPRQIDELRGAALKLAKSASKAAKMFGGGDDVMLHRIERGWRRHFLPKAAFRKAWDAVVFLSLTYYAFTLPLHIGFAFRAMTSGRRAMLCVDYTVDVLCVIDLVLSFRFFMHQEEGLVVFDAERVKARFMREHTVWAEVLAMLPLDLAVFLVPGRGMASLARVSKVLRLGKLVRYTSAVQTHLAERFKGISVATRRFLSLNVVMLLVCHWCGCLFIFFSDLSSSTTILSSDPGTVPTWIEADQERGDECAPCSFDVDHGEMRGFAGYLRAVYFAIVGMSTVGYGDITPQNTVETAYSTVMILFGGLMLPAIVGGLAALIGSMNRSDKEFRKKMASLRRIMKDNGYPTDMRERIVRYYDYLWARQGGVDEIAILNELPGPLRQRVALCVTGSALDNIPFLKKCEDAVRQSIVSVLVPRTFLPNDIVIRAGEVGREMYIIERGTLVVWNEDRTVAFASLHAGDYFGEACLLGTRPVRTATVIAKGYCDCFVLTLENLEEVMQIFPDWNASIVEAIAETLEKKEATNRRVEDNFSRFEKVTQRCESSAVDLSEHKKAGRAFRTFPPGSAFRHAWTVLLFLVTVYHAFAVPHRIAFAFDLAFVSVDWILDIVFVADFYLQARRFPYLEEGELFADRESIFRHYWNHGLKRDALAVLPLDLFAFAMPTPAKRNLALAFLRLPKILKLADLPRLWHEIDRMLETAAIASAPVQLLSLLGGVAVVAHWACCGFYMFSRYRNMENDCEGASRTAFQEGMAFDITEHAYCSLGRSWIQLQIEDGKLGPDGGSSASQYLRSLYWALPTLVVVVIGDVVPTNPSETLYAFVAMVVGMTVNGAIIGNVANLVSNLETDAAAFNERHDALRDYMHKHRVRYRVQARVNAFMNALWAGNGGIFSEANLLEDLPFTLRMAVTERSKVRYIATCPFFQSFSMEIVRALAFRLVPQVYSMHDVIVQHGDLGSEMYFLEKGSVEVIAQDRAAVLATLTKGTFFGETALFFKQRRTATIRSAEFSEVYMLTKDALDSELRQHDFDVSRMLDIFRTLQDTNKRRNAAVAKNLQLSEMPHSKLHRLVPDSIDAGVEHAPGSIELFRPNGTFRMVWDALLLACLLFNAIAVPYFAAFFREADGRSFSRVLLLSVCSDLVFAADVALQYFAFPFLEQGVLIADPSKRKDAYRAGKMPLDVLSALPVDAFCLTAAGFGRKLLYMWLRAPRLLRLVRLPAYLNQLQLHLSFKGVRIASSAVLVMKMLFAYLLMNHWYACVWFILHRYAERDAPKTWATQDGLATVDPATGEHDICSGDITDCYIRAFYLVLTTISSIGYGDIYPASDLETVWELCVVLSGACIFAGLIGAFGAFFQRVDKSGDSAFKSKMRALVEYMKYRNLPEELQSAILLHHRRSYQRSHCLDEKAVMQDLPTPLRMELALVVYRSVIDSVPILAEKDELTRKRVAIALSTQVCSQHTSIYEAGDIGWDIYFVGSGLVKVALPEDVSVLDAAGRAATKAARRKAAAVGNLYRRGNHFGESCLVSMSGVRQESTRAETVAELYLLSKDSILGICAYMPQAQKEKLFDDLLTRNGNTKHTFGEEEDGDEASGGCSSSDESDGDSVASRQGERSADILEDLAGKGSRGAAARRRRSKVRASEIIRLRSFSVQAAEESLQRRKEELDRDAARSDRLLFARGPSHGSSVQGGSGLLSPCGSGSQTPREPASPRTPRAYLRSSFSSQIEWRFQHRLARRDEQSSAPAGAP